MVQLILVVAVLVGVSALWFGGGQLSPWGSVATTTSPVEMVETVETYLDDIASSTAQRTADVIGESALESVRSVSEVYDEFPVRFPMLIGGVRVEASVATTVVDRIQGLSRTTQLPSNVVKLFVFDLDGPQSIWMKDMQYPIDIIWLDSEGRVVHIAPSVDPSTYPSSFFSPVPARYVVEAGAGFAATNGVVLGTQVELPLLR
jgi:uncharacterized protein